MRHIRKGHEPQSLLEYRRTPRATYEGLPQDVKEEVRERLAREQGFLCCYCMQRITPNPDGMKIEHWAPQSQSSERQLDWKNLLGACKGGEGSPLAEQHCDSHKGNTPIRVNPLEERCERLLRFLADGTIESDDPAVQIDLSQTLNLNYARLRNNRKAVLDAFREFMQRKYSGTTWPQEAMERALTELQEPHRSGMLQEYCQVPIYWLKKRLGQLGRANP
jgi:uncharacterized protein (TIGR02646 family)